MGAGGTDAAVPASVFLSHPASGNNATHNEALSISERVFLLFVIFYSTQHEMAVVTS
ncbi:hypothetical protein CAter282_4592 [Collimonas arenae]|uniref:Uncharacterized protein n=1 Tax=Collimonas arenae TaxID=279058 RepID=A0A127QQD8_9BURK|nr:hypothetical protein CAter282_4592 [Collimonas arenae]